MSATAVVRGPEVMRYGRHAAPPSAYGPADVHRLLPVPSTGSRATEPDDAEDARVEVSGDASRAEVVAPADRGAAPASPGEAFTKGAGFWARLRLPPKAA